MKEFIGVLAALGIVLVGFLSGTLILYKLTDVPRDEFNWSQQALRDPAADGCPGQYHSYAGEFLVGCWGQRGGPDADIISLDWTGRSVSTRLDDTRDTISGSAER